MSIKRSISLLNKGISANIYIVEKTNLIPIEFLITDYVLPSNAIATVYCTKSDGNLVKCVCDIDDNTISFQPEAGFFAVGENNMQIRITSEEKSLYSFETKVICDRNMASDEAEDVESQPTLVEQLLSKVGSLQGENAGLKNQLSAQEQIIKTMQSDMTTHDLEENVVTFTSDDSLGDEDNPLTWTEVEVLTNKEKSSSIFKKISQMFKNVRYLFNFIKIEEIQNAGYTSMEKVVETLDNTRLHITTLTKEVTLTANQYCSPYSYTTAFSVLDSDIEAYGEPINVQARNAASVPVPACFYPDRRSYNVVSDRAENKAFLTFIKIVKEANE